MKTLFVFGIRNFTARVLLTVAVSLLTVLPFKAFAAGEGYTVQFIGQTVGFCQVTPQCSSTVGLTPLQACQKWVPTFSPDGTNARIDGRGLCVFEYNSGLNTWSGSNVGLLLGTWVPPFDINTSACAGYPNVAAAAAADGFVSAPRTFSAVDSVNRPGLINVMGKAAVLINGQPDPSAPSTYHVIDCTGLNSGQGSKLENTTAAQTPVDTNYSKCGVGGYWYVDSTVAGDPGHCVINVGSKNSIQTDALSNCADGVGLGTFNGKLVCVPSNPAPQVAQNSAKQANDAADAAKNATAGTQSAIDAANLAIKAAQKAMDAALSMPGNSTVQGYAQQAVNAAKQAAGYAGGGLSLGGSGTGAGTGTGTGTGTGGASLLDGGAKECGSPGKPACRIDESGTPTDGAGAFNAAQTSLDGSEQAAKDLQTGAISASGKNTGWTFSFSFPASCQPIPMYLGVVIDVCAFQPIIHDLLSMLWIGATIFCCMAMVGRTLRGAA